MNIAYILHSTEAHGGATKAFLNMLQEIMSYDVNPFVVLPDRKGVFFKINELHIPTLVVNYRSSTYPLSHTLKQRLLFLPRLAARVILNHNATRVLTTWLKENNIHLVHSNTGIVRIGFDAAQKIGIPHIYHIREYRDLDFHLNYFPCKQSFYKQLKNTSSYTICITNAIQKYHQQHQSPSSRVIYDGVFSKTQDMPIVQTKNYFLFAGRIQASKGLYLLLQAYKTYAEQTPAPLPLKVAGANGDEAYYQIIIKYIKENNLTDSIELLGSCQDIDILMRKARALIVSSPFEGFGFCMPEAMQQGCLVIAHDTSGTKEQLDNALKMTGQEIALRYETTEQLASLLAEVSCHPAAYYDGYTRKAFDVVNLLYTKETHAEKVYQFYKDIIASRPSCN